MPGLVDKRCQLQPAMAVFSVLSSVGSRWEWMKRFIFLQVCASDMQLHLSMMFVFSAQVDNF